MNMLILNNTYSVINIIDIITLLLIMCSTDDLKYVNCISFI